MTPPAPSCGHGGDSFTYVTIAELWMCSLCIRSVGALYSICTCCGRMPRRGELLLGIPGKAGILCFDCRRAYLAQRPRS